MQIGMVRSYKQLRANAPIQSKHTEFRVFWVISLNKLLVLYRSQYMTAFQLIVSTLLWAYLLASQFYSEGHVFS